MHNIKDVDTAFKSLSLVSVEFDRGLSGNWLKADDHIFKLFNSSSIEQLIIDNDSIKLNGKVLDYYINGTLVFSKSDSLLAFEQVSYSSNYFLIRSLENQDIKITLLKR